MAAGHTVSAMAVSPGGRCDVAAAAPAGASSSTEAGGDAAPQLLLGPSKKLPASDLVAVATGKGTNDPGQEACLTLFRVQTSAGRASRYCTTFFLEAFCLG